mgnify:FL=1|tara:strand:+ start:116 stop:331 length:216 start_codon:yes stop_codon:yes gene_type:complete
MEILENDFSSDRYSAILGNLRDNDYLSQVDVDILLSDSLKNRAIYLNNISVEKAEIVRRALFENSSRPKSK